MKHYYLISVRDGKLDLVMPTSDDILAALETVPEQVAFESFNRSAVPGDFTIINERYLICRKTDQVLHVENNLEPHIVEPVATGDPEIDAAIAAAAEERTSKGKVFTRKP